MFAKIQYKGNCFSSSVGTIMERKSNSDVLSVINLTGVLKGEDACKNE